MPLQLTKTIDGPMIVLANDDYVGKALITYGEYCFGERLLAERYVTPGSVVVDAGANMGAHTLHLAQLTGPKGMVWAFEPQKVLANLARASLLINGFENADVWRAALGAVSGHMFIPKLDYNRQGNFGGIGLEGPGSEHPQECVPMYRLDDLIGNSIKPVSLMKVDVEGFEQEVLQGAEEVLRKHKPVLIVENDRRSKYEALIDYMRSIGYDPYWCLMTLYNPNNFKKVGTNIWGKDLVSIDMLCLPAGMPPPEDIPLVVPNEKTNAVIVAGMQRE